MKKNNYWLLIMGLYHFCSLSMNAQVTVTDNNTIKLGSTDNFIGTNNTGNFGDAYGVFFRYDNSNQGILIEQGNIESSGIFLDEDKVVLWSPGDVHLINFCDEDLFDSNGGYSSAVVSYIDDYGYYHQISDSTSKVNIKTINASLSKIIQLRGIEYNHKTKEENNNDKSNKNQASTALRYGFLAQEVETVIPEAVETGKTGIKYINYQAMIPFLVEALKEQQTQIDKQDQQIIFLQIQMNAIQQSLKLK
jgi:hypothetical protein